MVKGLGTVIYHVTDLNRAKAWYANAFQQQPYFDQPFYVGFNIAGYELGLDPFATSEDVDFPVTLGDFVSVYENAAR